MNVLIFADVHLEVSPKGAATRDAFVTFLRAIDTQNYGRIIILGDLFDFWFEYKHVVFSGYFEILRALAELRDRGVELHLVCGNHDFWAGFFLERRLDIAVHRASYRCTLGNRRVLFIHGDGINLKDYRYRLYKGIARSRLAIGLFRLLHPDLAMGIAQRLSQSSRVLLSSEKPHKGHEVEALLTFARNTIEKGDVDVVVCAHSHHPALKDIPPEGLYINTGDWMKKRTYVRWNGTSFELKTYEEGVPF